MFDNVPLGWVGFHYCNVVALGYLYIDTDSAYCIIIAVILEMNTNDLSDLILILLIFPKEVLDVFVLS